MHCSAVVTKFKADCSMKGSTALFFNILMTAPVEKPFLDDTIAPRQEGKPNGIYLLNLKGVYLCRHFFVRRTCGRLSALISIQSRTCSWAGRRNNPLLGSRAQCREEIVKSGSTSGLAGNSRRRILTTNSRVAGTS